jgi:hypothetical protein
MGGVAALIVASSFALVMLAFAFVVFKMARTLSITNGILNDLRKEAMPLMGKFQTTMDHVNDEMGYVDGILKSGEKLAERANSTTKALQHVLAPGEDLEPGRGGSESPGGLPEGRGRGGSGRRIKRRSGGRFGVPIEGNSFCCK